MAITLYISLISLLILSMCQINLSVALGVSQYRYHSFPLRQQDGRLVLLNDYHRQHYPVMIKEILPFFFDKHFVSSFIHNENHPIIQLFYPIIRSMKERDLIRIGLNVIYVSIVNPINACFVFFMLSIVLVKNFISEIFNYA